MKLKGFSFRFSEIWFRRKMEVCNRPLLCVHGRIACVNALTIAPDLFRLLPDKNDRPGGDQ